MTQRAAFENGCRKKRAYKRRHDAKKALRQLQTTNPGSGHNLAPYRCDFCGFYHLGNSQR